MKRINYFRSEKAYLDKDAAKIIQNGSALKKNMSREDNPLMVMFEYGTSDNKEGYWSYENLVLKMEYYLDCLKFLYPSFDIIFIFEHLCGYDLTREDRLKTSIMRNYFGG